MTTTLTERYIAEAIRGIPAASRDDGEVELTASIADAVDARIAQGEDQASAEKAVLNDLGDPGVLAAGYSDFPMHLIGPRYFLTWWRLLKLLWIIVPAAAMGSVALGLVLAEAPPGGIVGTVITTGLTTFVHIAFWVTLVFFVLERADSRAELFPWDVSKLREIPEKGTGRCEMIAALVFRVIGIVALVWDQTRGLVIQNGTAFPFLNPGLWPWWIAGLMVLMAAQTALVIAVYRSGRRSPAFAIITSVLVLAFAIPATFLVSSGQLVNPEFVAAVFTENGVEADTIHTLGILVGAGIVGFSAWSIIDVWFKTVRDTRR